MIRTRTLEAFLLVTLLFGTAFPAIKAGLAYLPPLLFAAARYALAAVVLVGYALATTDRWRPRTRREWAAVAGGGVFLIGGTGLNFVGQQFTTSGVAAIIFSLTPVLTVLLAWLVLPDERPTRRGLAGVVVGFVGVAIVVRPTPDALVDPTVVGRSLIVLGTISITIGTVLVRRIHAAMPIPALTGWSMAIGATIQLGFAAALGESVAIGSVEPAAVAIVVYLAVFAGAFGFVLYFWLLQRVGPLEANLVTYVNPVVALVTGWLLLDEAIQPAAIAGFLVIAVGFGLLKNRELAAELTRYRGAAR